MNGWKQKWVNQRNKKEILDKNQVRAGQRNEMLFENENFLINFVLSENNKNKKEKNRRTRSLVHMLFSCVILLRSKDFLLPLAR